MAASVRRLLLVGCGKMGGAMLAGWHAAGIAQDYLVIEPNRETVPDLAGITPLADIDGVPDGEIGAIVLAVKPQAMEAVVPAYRPWAAPDTLFLSVAAGKSVAYFQDRLGSGARIVRAMPNTPAAIGRGVSVLTAGPGVGGAQRALADRLMAAVGSVEWVEDEGLLDAVTALSGGGPAYVFLLIETLAAAGVRAGLPDEMAMRLARQTVIGSAALADRSEETAETLRRNVTSPAGTTEAALKVLMAQDGVQPLFDRAIAAATARSRELAG